jgi:putative tricarboxylic transport membrane protein
LNLPLIGIWVKILKVPYQILFPLILLFCVVGAFSLNRLTEDVLVMIAFGAIGYIMKNFKYDAAPLVLALVLSPMMENSLRQSLLVSQGSFLIFFTRPISAIILIATLILLIVPILPWAKARKW